MQGRTRRNGVDRCRNFGRDCPGAGGAARDEPDAVLDRIIGTAGLDHRYGGVGDIFEAGAFDRFQFGFAVIANTHLRLLAVDRRGLRDLIVDQRVLRLYRAAHRGEYGAFRVAVGDLGEIRRELVARDEAPGAVGERFGAEPAPGDQDIVFLTGDVDDDMAAGVLDIEQLRIRNWQVFRLTCRLNQLRRSETDMEGRDYAARNRRLDVRRWRVHQIDLGPGCLQRFGEAGRRLCRDGPGAFGRLGAPPPLQGAQVVGAGRLVEQDQGRCVDHAQQLAASDLAELGLAVDQDEQGRCFAVNNSGGLVAYGLGLAGLGFGDGKACR
ncbi:hypothetical protein FG93_04522 [Bosea sp. LC85]|nr:hypothetical protein FG93_04522 [Bosea sp. LC85]